MEVFGQRPLSLGNDDDILSLLLVVNLTPFHDPLMRALLPLLTDPKPLSVRKRAYMALCKRSSYKLVAFF